MFLLKIKILTRGARLPQTAHPGDLGCDIFSAENVIIPVGEQRKIKTGVALQFPDGWGCIVKDRSSLASKRIYSSGGVIDAGYRGEIIVMLRNGSKSDYVIKKEDKIAQIIPVKAQEWQTIEVEELTDTMRAEGGFGSTGKK